MGEVKKILSCLPFFAKGRVIKGFGRGSKELGIPTANLPENTVNTLPPALESGIYYGFANVDRGDVHKMVLSIGWNPFYKNEKRSMECHIIHTYPDDFYGSELRLVILGYIRPERNYDSLEALIKAIHNDISIAKEELDKADKLAFMTQRFFTNTENDISNIIQNGSL